MLQTKHNINKAIAEMTMQYAQNIVGVVTSRACDKYLLEIEQ